ncbi:SulP family inorganic anion transporter [Domibacillus enclensis]|uniref:Sodium-independent anion transporter n=1 Tax=Domibacillus enclensis TaxID=1017273 RepID=A0A1N6ZD74_9BACI|nr:SulP family inorganic anion transporter [Domibacillus enclensis]OXS76670.1 sodium-independent anion transporter [Domibacillus enclensis]SIR24850.1 sulfate permease, SulP family [Domibacillus enclensis]
MFTQLKKEWFGNVRGDVLSGIVVALALIPEAIAFSIIAGVDPMVGLYASFSMAVVIAFMGGRPAMISAATGAMALVMVTLVKEHGLQYLFAATILTGILQVTFGWLKVARFMKFIPRSVMVGFVNALAILIFMAQVPHFIGISTMTYVFVAATLAIIYVLPRITKAVPSPLVAIVVMTVIAVYGGIDLRTVGDLGTITQSLPSFFIPDVPFNVETLSIIFPTALALSIVGLLESLLTASIVDDMTDTTSNKNREARGQGIANIVTGFFGGMAGCAMIGQSVINVKSGGRGRLSTFVAGTFLLFLIMVLGGVVVQIPMPALVGVMIMVSIGTFDWSSFKAMTKIPITDSIVMIVTVVTVVITHDLSKGVFAGIILSALFFTVKISKVHVSSLRDGQTLNYRASGQVFFASVTDFIDEFDYQPDGVERVTIDFSEAHVWDDSGVAAIDKIVLKYRENGFPVSLTGLNESSSSMIKKMGVHDKPGEKLSGH